VEGWLAQPRLVLRDEADLGKFARRASAPLKCLERLTLDRFELYALHHAISVSKRFPLRRYQALALPILGVCIAYNRSPISVVDTFRLTITERSVTYSNDEIAF
jgi:hypothetical protein